MTTTERRARRWRRALPRAARTTIIGWVLLLVLLALAVVTLVTWRLLIRSTDERMDLTLEAEIFEFTQILDTGIDPDTGAPFDSISDVLETLITYNLARPNEKFLGYVDGEFRYQSRIEAPVLLSDDAEFTRLVGSVTGSTFGRYESEAGEVRYLAVPVSLEGDPRLGVAVVAYFADQERQAADDAAQVMLGVGAVTVLLAAAGAWLVAGRVLRPVRDVAATAATITDTDLSGRIPVSEPPADELAELAVSVNAMLDRVARGVAAQRRFLDDAGHELRTPITIVRGHLEVLDPDDPADVRETLVLVDDELERMNRLVSDLLLLARAEQPEFVQPEPVDVAALTTDVFGKVRRLAEDRVWLLETTAHVDALLDRQRVTQALAALADNAVRYTAPGDRISLGSVRSGDELHLWVADTGPGIPEEERGRVFERFARGAVATARAEGAGLGLSIVRAIAVAHGGRVLLDSGPGHGATFTLVLPLRLAAPPAEEEAGLFWDAPAPAADGDRPTPATNPGTAHPVDGGEHRESSADRRGRAAHRGVHREGAAGQRLLDRGGR